MGEFKMEAVKNLFLQDTWGIVTPLFVFSITCVFGFILRRLLFVYINRWAKKTTSQIDDVIVGAITFPSLIWLLMLGAYFALDASTLSRPIVASISKAIIVLGILSVTIVVANIVGKFIKLYSGKGGSTSGTSLIQTVSRVIIFIIGALIILNELGISITPILATLGVGGIAVALALQDTLSNLFSGVYTIAARQIKVGDYIKLDTGMEGYVTDINWRITKIKTISNNIILVPNEKLTKTIITNYNSPEKEMGILIDVIVHRESDLTHVEKVTVDVARDVMKTMQGGVPSFEPHIRYTGFTEYGIQFAVTVRANEFSDQFIVKHELIKQLHERYRKEGIVIPYPVREIHSDKR